ncbi:MAG: YceD family protein [Roseiflexaceae bacterium]
MHIHKPMIDLKFNVAQLLREEVGARREYDFTEAALPLDDETTLRQITGWVRFTRTPSGVLGDVEAHGGVEMPCMRCLNLSTQAITVQFRDEFHSKIEVNTGISLPEPDEEDPFYITENHLVDLGEAIREYTLLELPMQPLCKLDCQGICPGCGADRNTEACRCQSEESDDRFAALKALLNK